MLPMLPLVIACLLVSLVRIGPVTAASRSERCPGSPNQCSLHGSCMLNRLGERVCNCQWGYAGDDCAKSA